MWRPATGLVPDRFVQNQIANQLRGTVPVLGLVTKSCEVGWEIEIATARRRVGVYRCRFAKGAGSMSLRAYPVAFSESGVRNIADEDARCVKSTISLWRTA
jgi:hypothetical protein